jgi:AraC-like DNA-binding protein
MTVSIQHIPQLIIIIQCLTYVLFFFSWKGFSQKTNKYQLVFFLLLTFQMLGLLLAQNGFYLQVFQRINIIYGFAYAPLFYFYTRESLYEKKNSQKHHIIHGVPLLVSLIVIFSGIAINYFLVYILYLIITIAYFILSGRLINDFAKIILQTRSLLNTQRLYFLRWIFGIYLLVLIADILQFLSENIGFFSYGAPVLRILVFAFVLLLINLIFYFSVFHANLLYAISEEEKTLIPDNPILQLEQITVNTTNSNEKEPGPDILILLEDLEKYIRREKPYLNASLTLKDLGAALNIQPRLLSHMINSYLDTNFSNYINTLRVQEAAEKLGKPKDDKETIAEVMYTCGFNTKSAFFTAFKKQFGISPKQYKEKQVK